MALTRISLVAELQASQQTVCVDFDGTVTEDGKYLGWGQFRDPSKKAIQLIKSLQARGFKVVVLTARPEIDEVKKWLTENKIEIDDVTNVKPLAVAYLDNRGVNWSGDNKDALEKILKLAKVDI